MMRRIDPRRPKHDPTRIAPSDLLAGLTASHRESMLTQYEALLPRLRSAIGEPYFCSNGFILYNGDSTKLMSRLAEAGLKTHLTVTSPPYNIGKEYEDVRPLDEFVGWCADWMQTIHGMTTDTGAFWLNLGYLEVPERGRNVPLAYLLWDKADFYLQQEVVWHYGAGVSCRKRFSPRNEKWLYYVRDPRRYTFNLDDVRDPNVKYPNQKRNGKFRCNPLGKNPSDVWEIPKVTSGRNRSSRERTSHPAQFPLAVVHRIVRVSSDAGDVVMDPFSGSGSTGIAAIGNGRVYVGFELSADYCEMAVQRFHAFEEERRVAAGQQGLFAGSQTGEQEGDEAYRSQQASK